MSISSRVTGLFERVPGSGVWWTRWQDARGKRHLKKIGKKSDAKDFLEKKHREALLGKVMPEKLPRVSISFGELASDALAHSRDANSERSTAELELKLKVIGPDFDQRPADSITKQDITDWLIKQTKDRKWSPATRNRYQAAFSLVFRVAMDNEKVTLNPAARIKRKMENNGRVRFLSAKEETKLREAITDPRQLAALEISLHTGMRRGEQFGLSWSLVDLEKRIVTLPKTKSGKTRHIPLNAVALAAFVGLRGTGQPDGSTVFPNSAGDAVSGPRGWFEPAVERAGLKDYTWHCNRHTFASRLVMAGVDIRTVAQLMGHSTIQMTMRYAHLAPEHNQAAVDRLIYGKR